MILVIALSQCSESQKGVSFPNSSQVSLLRYFLSVLVWWLGLPTWPVFGEVVSSKNKPLSKPSIPHQVKLKEYIYIYNISYCSKIFRRATSLSSPLRLIFTKGTGGTNLQSSPTSLSPESEILQRRRCFFAVLGIMLFEKHLGLSNRHSLCVSYEKTLPPGTARNPSPQASRIVDVSLPGCVTLSAFIHDGYVVILLQ